jgi:two-component system, LytTR family, response regulator
VTDEAHLRVAVVDDKLLARQRIEDLLASESGVSVIASVDNGFDAVDAIRSGRPDVVFLDVQMPGLNGLDVVREVGPDAMPKTIFVTAFDRFALDAFEVAAVDYLVKPFDDERFRQALARARKMIVLEEGDRTTKELRSLLEIASGREPASEEMEAKEYIDRISVETRGKIRVVPVSRIEYITASGPYAELHVGDQAFVIRQRMQTLEERLDPGRFFRIHRSAIVRLDTIDELLRGTGGAYAVRLKNGVELSVSRNRREELEIRMGIER